MSPRHALLLKTPLDYGRAEVTKGNTARSLLTYGALVDQAETYSRMVDGEEITGDGAKRFLRASLAMVITARLIKRDGLASVLQLAGIEP